MKRFSVIILTFVLVFAGCQSKKETTKDQNPNILIIYADDLGLGDVSAYGSGQIETPNIDELAEGGIKFTNAYSTSAMCTPSRYSLLTGKYPFREESAVILSAEDPMCIDPEMTTLPDVLRNYGYRTGIVGKWHLGLGDSIRGQDWNGEVKPGPLEVGFDESFLLPVTNDRVPTVYLDGHHVYELDPDDEPLQVRYPDESHHAFQEEQFGKEKEATLQPLVGNLPTGLTHPEELRYSADVQHSGTIVNGVSRIGHQAGGRSAWWDDENRTDLFNEKARNFMSSTGEKPFFLFLSMPQPHVPRMPNKRFIGSSGCGLRGDAIVEFDWIVGQMIQYLKEAGQFDNTLILLTSDNGPVFFDGYHDGALEEHNGHNPSNGFRGGKYIAYEGGTRMPTIAHWPRKIKGGQVSDALISQVDFMASLTSLVGGELPKDELFDGRDVLPALLGESEKGREYIVQHSSDGLGLRKGKWKYIEAGERSDFGYNRHNLGEGHSLQIEKPDTIEYLFDLEADPKEENNLAKQNPDKLKELRELLQEIKK
jgi:arylsulfatase A